MHTARFALLGLALLAGCTFAVPLAPPDQAHFDPRLVGRWQVVDPDQERPDEFLIRRLGDNLYTIRAETTDMEGDRSVELMEGHVVLVDTAAFLNVRPVRPAEPGTGPEWLIYRYHLASDNVARVRQLSPERAGEHRTAAALREHVLRNLEDARLYEETVELRRIGR